MQVRMHRATERSWAKLTLGIALSDDLPADVSIAIPARKRRRDSQPAAAGLVNELVETQHHNQRGRVLQRWGRYNLNRPGNPGDNFR
jgi:hypothetical protein